METSLLSIYYQQIFVRSKCWYYSIDLMQWSYGSKNMLNLECWIICPHFVNWEVLTIHSTTTENLWIPRIFQVDIKRLIIMTAKTVKGINSLVDSSKRCHSRSGSVYNETTILIGDEINSSCFKLFRLDKHFRALKYYYLETNIGTERHRIHMRHTSHLICVRAMVLFEFPHRSRWFS